jgi:hypothetical protein
MTTALVSVLTGIPVRADVAMTGEITLRGEVLPIGGLKEKLLAAHRGGIKLVLIPEENVKDLADIPDNVKNASRSCRCAGSTRCWNSRSNVRRAAAAGRRGEGRGTGRRGGEGCRLDGSGQALRT